MSSDLSRQRHRNEAPRFGAAGALVPFMVQAVALAFFCVQAWLFQRKLASPRTLVPTDFNDYHVVGRMVLQGRWAQAYQWPDLQAAQVSQLGTWAFLPWAYPPPFTLFTGLLGLLPIGAAYLLFIAASWVLFYTALRRLTGRAAVPALIVVLPAVLINAKCGQNGFLSAGLIGWTLVGLRARTAKAGWPLGLMIFKPHLALGVGLLALLEGHWRAIARAALLAIALCAAATIAFAPSIWTAFRAGTAFASEAIWRGDFPLERMTSIFAALHRIGVPPAAAMAIQLLFVAAGALALLEGRRRGLDRDLLLAASVGLSLIVSPYSYDYDMVALTLAVGLILPRFLARASLLEALLLPLLSWIAVSNYVFVGLRQIFYGVPKIDASMRLWTISPFALAGMAILVVAVLRRPLPDHRSGLMARAYGWVCGNRPA